MPWWTEKANLESPAALTDNKKKRGRQNGKLRKSERKDPAEVWLMSGNDENLIQTESPMAVYPVRRQCPRFQAPG